MDGSRSELASSRHSAVAKTTTFKHRGRSPDPLKTHPGQGVMVVGLAGRQFRYVTKYKGRQRRRVARHPGPLPQAGAAAAAPWRGARPFDGRPGASRLFGGRCRAACPRC
jgi:hypothetical protein